MEVKNGAVSATAIPMKKRKAAESELATLKSNFDKRSRVLTESTVAEEGIRESCDGASVQNVRDDGDGDNAVCSSPSCSEASASCCSSNGCSSQLGREDRRVDFVDLENDDGDDEREEEVESQTYNSLRESHREMTPPSNIQPQLGQVQSTQQPEYSKRRSSTAAEKMPSELELEDFFTAAEKDIRDRFSQKYNYDIAKDTPLEGRFVWDRLKP